MVSKHLELTMCNKTLQPLCKMPLINHEEKKIETGGHRCAEQWKFLNGKCFTSSNRYKTSGMRYEEALAFCVSLHKESSLAKITSQAEIKYVSDEANFWVPPGSSFWVINFFFLIFKFREIRMFLR